jgi:glutaminyl-tRNA synthetase
MKTAYIIRCTSCEHDDQGRVTTIHATYDPETRGGNTPDGRKIKGTIHWVDARTAITAQVRLYDTLFNVADPDIAERNFLDHLNPDSLETLRNCQVEASLAGAEAPQAFQFLRLGYFCLDAIDSRPDALVFNRSVSLKDSFKPQK